MQCDAMRCVALQCDAMKGFGWVPGCSAINKPHGMKIVYLHSILPCLWRLKAVSPFLIAKRIPAIILPCLWRLKAGCFDGWQRGIGRQCTRCFQSVVKVAQRWIATVLATTATTINICCSSITVLTLTPSPYLSRLSSHQLILAKDLFAHRS